MIQHKTIINTVENAIQQTSPEAIIKKEFRRKKNTVFYKNHAWNLDYYKQIKILCIGKTAASSYQGIKDLLPDKNIRFIVYHTGSSSEINDKKILSFKGDHPFLSQKNIDNSIKILAELKKIEKDDLLLVFMGGGSSSLFEIPGQNIKKSDCIILYQELLKINISIYDINMIRSLASSLKNGKILNYIMSRHIHVFLFSDVFEDLPQTIGSGPFYHHDYSTELEALKKRTQLEINSLIEQYLPAKKVYSFDHFILTNNLTLLKEIQRSLKLEIPDYHVQLYETYINLDIKDFLNLIQNQVKKISQKTVVIMGGEIKLSITGKGLGGKNQELLMRLLKEINLENISIFALASDGRDGPTDSAGAYIDNSIYKKITEEKIDLTAYIAQNNSYTLFKRLGNHIKIDSINNLNDIFLIIRD